MLSPPGPGSNSRDRLIEVHTAHGEEIGQTRSFREVRETQARLLRAFSFNSLLIIGPGHGDEAETLFSALGRDSQAVRIQACDLNPERLTHFARRFPVANLLQGSVLSAEIQAQMRATGPVDLIQMSFVLHDHGEADKPALLAALFKAVRPGGYLVAADPILPEFPNYWPVIAGDSEKIARVDAGLREYYQNYIAEVSRWDLPEKRRQELLESLEKGLRDALEHRDGREAFDTPAGYRQRFEQAGFVNLAIVPTFNNIQVVRAQRPPE